MAGTALWPADDSETQELLSFFQLEKAFYEIEYEISNRPSWTDLPVRGALRILSERGIVS